MDDGAITKKVLESLRIYLQDNLPVDKDFISELHGKSLLAKTNTDQLVALADKGDKQCLHRLLDYMFSYYDVRMLEDFCFFLEEDSKHAKPLLQRIAERIRKEIKTQQTTLMQQQHDQQHYQDDNPGPSGVNRPPGVVGSTSSMETSIQSPTQPQRPLFLPVIGELKSPFSDLATAVLSTIKSLKPEALEALCMHLSNFLNPDIPRMAPPPPVPRVFDQLVPFLQARWDPLQIHILQEIVRKLRKRELTSQLKKYEKTLKNKVSDFLSGCKTPKILHKKLPQHTSVAVNVEPTPQEISLSRILELKEFFITNLGLPDTLFTGFSEGSTILFFSIPEDSVWCLPMCLRPSNLPQLEEWKVVSLSVEGAFTVDIVKRRVFDVQNMQSLSDLKAEVSLWKGKVYVLEDILSHHKEGPFEGEKYSSDQPLFQQVKSEPLSKASKPGDVPESEPRTKKPKLKGPDYPDVKTKLETKSEVEATHSEIGIKSELKTGKSTFRLGTHPVTESGVEETHSEIGIKSEVETGESALRLGTHPELETVESALRPGFHPELETVESALRPGFHPELETAECALRPGTHPELETVESALRLRAHPEVQDTPPEPHSDVKGKGKKLPTSHNVRSTQSAPSSLVTPGPAHHSMHPIAPQFLSPHEPTHWPLESDPPHMMGLSPLQQIGTGLPLQLGTRLPQPMETSPFYQMGPGPYHRMGTGLSHSMGTVPSSLFPSTPVQREPLEPLLPTRTGEVTSSETTHERIQRLRATEENIHKLILFEEEKLKLTHLYWREQPNVLKRMWWPTAVYLNDKIFVGDRRGWESSDRILYVFNVVSRKWSKVRFHDSRAMYGFTLATTANQVHTLGGDWRKDGKVEEYSKVVFSLDDNMKWSNTLPPLNIGRVWATSTSFEDMIVVAGGWGRNGDLSSVEVLDSSQASSTWWEICDLPVKSWIMQCTVTDNELFIGCGSGTDNTVYTAKLSAVKESLISNDPKSSVSPESFWQSLPKTPLKWSGLVAVNNCLVTVGGCDDDDKLHSSVNLYDCYKKTWTKVPDIRESRAFPAVVVCTFENKQELFVLCGWGACTSVESCEL